MVKEILKAMAKNKSNKKSQDKKEVHPDGFIAYQMHKAQNQIGAEYEGGVSNVFKGESLTK